MLKWLLLLVLLFVACFSLATYLEPRQAARADAGGRSVGVLASLLGEGRKMFANSFYAKADVYFHRGKYPSIFEQNAREDEDHMVEEAIHHGAEEPDEPKESLPPARDWIERFGRHFYPSEHVHLKEGEEGEMLPWLRISVELDPRQPKMYALTAYWLRARLSRPKEAEEFLRQGLRSNLNDPEILNELGWLYLQNRNDPVRACNIWKVALRRWRELEEPKKEPDQHLLRGILDGLAQSARLRNRIPEEIGYLKQLKEISPQPAAVQKMIDERNAQLQSVPH